MNYIFSDGSVSRVVDTTDKKRLNQFLTELSATIGELRTAKQRLETLMAEDRENEGYYREQIEVIEKKIKKYEEAEGDLGGREPNED